MILRKRIVFILLSFLLFAGCKNTVEIPETETVNVSESAKTESDAAAETAADVEPMNKNEVYTAYVAGTYPMEKLLANPLLHEELAEEVNAILDCYRVGANPLDLFPSPDPDCSAVWPAVLEIPDNFTAEDIAEHIGTDTTLILRLNEKYTLRLVWDIGLFGESAALYSRRLDIELHVDVPVGILCITDSSSGFDPQVYTPAETTVLNDITLPFVLAADADLQTLLYYHKITDPAADVFAVCGNIIKDGKPDTAVVFHRTADGSYKSVTLPLEGNKSVCKGILLGEWNGGYHLIMLRSDGTMNGYTYDSTAWINTCSVSAWNSSAYVETAFACGAVSALSFRTPDMIETQLFLSFDGGLTYSMYQLPLIEDFYYVKAAVVDCTVTKNGNFLLLYELTNAEGSLSYVQYEAEVGAFEGILTYAQPGGTAYCYTSQADSGNIQPLDDGLIEYAVVYSDLGYDIGNRTEITGGTGDYSAYDLALAVHTQEDNIPTMSIDYLEPMEASEYEGVREDGYFLRTYEYHGEFFGPITVPVVETFDTSHGPAVYECVTFSTGEFSHSYHIRIAKNYLLKFDFMNTNYTDEDCRAILETLIFEDNT